MIKRILMALLVVIAMVAMTSCANYNVEQDKRAVEIDGYHIIKTDKKLVGCHNPGESGWGGWGNTQYYYPAGQRTYSFTGNSSESESDPLPVVTADNQTLHVPGFIKFTLTSDCKELYKFHKQIGLKYKAYEDTGWNNLLKDYMGVPISNALNDEFGGVNWQEAYKSASLRQEIEKKMDNGVLQNRINSSLGGDWIVINSVSLSKPEAPKALTEGLEAAQKAALDNAAQKQRNQVIQTKYDSLRQCRQSGISDQSCLTIYLAEKGDIPFYMIPQGGNVNVTPSR